MISSLPRSSDVIHLVAIDLDGTLLRSDGTLSERTLRAIGAVRRRGIPIALVTARPPRAVVPLARNAGLSGIAICQNGAVTVDLVAGVIRDRILIESGAAADLIGRLKSRLPGSVMACEAGEAFRYEHGYHSIHEIPIDAELVIAEAMADHRLTKLLVQHDGLAFDELLAAVSSVVGTAAHVTYTGTEFVEITAPGVTKLAALERLAAELEVHHSEVLAFGDMPIDLPMLLWAGRGIAVANAHPEVLAAPLERTVSNDEDGVALVLEAAGFR